MKRLLKQIIIAILFLTPQTYGDNLSSFWQRITNQKNLDSMRNLFIEKLKLTPHTNPELLALFNTIKQDFGITEEIVLFKSADNLFPCGMLINIGDNFTTIGIAIDFDENQPVFPAQVIQTLAHELGHFLQHNNDPKSYQSKLKATASEEEKKEDNIKNETGADANAAGYIDCLYCLKQQRLLAPSTNHPRGYFSKTDYQPYIDRAIEDNLICPAHAQLRNSKNHEQLSSEMTIANLIDVKNFLPSKDRSNYPASCYNHISH